MIRDLVDATYDTGWLAGKAEALGLPFSDEQEESITRRTKIWREIDKEIDKCQKP